MGSESKSITLGYSPCPNDTFIFNGLVNAGAGLRDCAVREELHDVETLNEMAFSGKLDVTKLSFYAWLMVKDHYRLLSSGGALGYGCGPVVVSRRPLTLDDMTHCRIVLPGRWTTAHLLFRMWAPLAKERAFDTYDRIFDALTSGQADCGVIIHESRFTFKQMGFHQVVDLGAWWEDQTGLPIPLGCIAVHKRIDEELANQVEQAIRQSIVMAQEDPEATLPYIRSHAQEMTAQVLDAHIHAFVNEFSLDLGEQGRMAVASLESKARQIGILP